MEGAAEVFGVSDIVDELHEIAVFCKQQKIELTDMSAGGELYVDLEKYEIDVNDLHKFIDEVYKKAKKRITRSRS